MTKKQKKRVNKKLIPVAKRVIKSANFFDPDDTTNFSKKEIKRIEKDIIKLLDEYAWVKKKGIMDDVSDLVADLD